MARQQAAISLFIAIVIVTVPIVIAGRAPPAPAATATFIEPPPAAPVAALVLQAPPAPAAVVFLQPPPAHVASVVLHPPVPPLPAASSAISQHQPADDDHHLAAATSYHIHFTKIGLLGVLVSFLAGCFLCALFIVFVARSTRAQAAANGPAGQEVGGGAPAMESAALRCLSCVTRVAAFL